MVRSRLITVLTVNNGVLFRTRNFIPDYRYTINFVDAWSVDEVVLLDITRPGEGDRENFYAVVEHFARNCFVPLTVGGGVRSLEDIEILLGLGADKVTVNTGAFLRPEFISEAAQAYGSQCVVLSIDAARKGHGGYEVYSHFGRQAQGIEPSQWAKRAQDLGAGEILIQSIERDGTLEGYDNHLSKMVSTSVEIPVLVCSGAGRWQHFVEGFRE
ncbi:MAG: imidazole glycerol phosphate synthase cyclase subunit, partial [Deltaproteobacteria bacterium]|nr:imidazole glycerol phosphate synthase cyclase subunit [Deltaproteobacteria bacterium]